MMDIIGHRKIFYAVSGVLVLASIVVFVLWGLRPGIDFSGGSILELEFSGVRPDVQELKSATAGWSGGTILFTPAGERGLLVRTEHLSEEKHQELVGLISGSEKGLFVETRFDSIGPTIGRELKNRSFLSLVLVITLIVLYVAWAFRKVSRPIQSWKYGVVTVITLAHDVILPVGVFAFLGRFYMIEVDTLFVTALLTIMGFSVHDTIVVFDRIREHLKALKASDGFEGIVNQSVNETMVRSVNTSLTVLLALFAILLFGGESVGFFSLALIIGIVAGTYSSIFIASPLLVTWYGFDRRAGSGKY
ncbi:MAG: protein translocase subunit SecF [Candidatus Sungbacteria bacterium]|nr:protein translocase subunit SecF [Candidatus Sungbacteria bacterium]